MISKCRYTRRGMWASGCRYKENIPWKTVKRGFVARCRDYAEFFRKCAMVYRKEFAPCRN